MMPELPLRCVILRVEPKDQNVYLESNYEKHRSACSFGHSKLHLVDLSHSYCSPLSLLLARSLALPTRRPPQYLCGMLRCLC
jgi:hypothetical protein